MLLNPSSPVYPRMAWVASAAVASKAVKKRERSKRLSIMLFFTTICRFSGYSKYFFEFRDKNVAE